MKRAVVVLADGFEEIEALAPVDLLRRAGVEVVLAGLTGLEQSSARGVRIACDRLFADICGSTDNVDALILPGGAKGSENLGLSGQVLEFVSRMNAQGKIVAAICAAPAVVLARTAVLEGRKATCYPGMENLFSSGTKFSADPVVVDRNIVTSRGVGTSLAFALALVGLLAGEAVREKVSRAILFS